LSDDASGANTLERGMKNLFNAARLLLLDFASTLCFLAVYLATHNVLLAVVLGVALAFAQIGWRFIRRDPIDTMQWMSFFLVVASGTATMLTNDPRFVMVKPSIIYAIVGVVMLKPGWMNRYLPPIARELVPDVAVTFGFVWAGLMFASAALNLIVVANFSVAAWATIMSVYGPVSKLALFAIQYATMRAVAIRRRRAGAAVATPQS
jgi:intracellular septation protein